LRRRSLSATAEAAWPTDHQSYKVIFYYNEWFLFNFSRFIFFADQAWSTSNRPTIVALDGRGVVAGEGADLRSDDHPRTLRSDRLALSVVVVPKRQ
jgi:hypothetical protein